MRASVAKDYVVVMIDQDRMSNGKEMAAELRKGKRGGIPWCVVMDGDGTQKITSDGPDGNCGCPATPGEIDHFLSMIDKTRRHMSVVDRSIIERELRLYGAKLTNPPAAWMKWRKGIQARIKHGRFASAYADLERRVAAGYPIEEVLTDAKLRALREDPEFRPKLFAIAKGHVRSSAGSMIDPVEKGRRIRVIGKVIDMETGAPLPGTVIQFFHTDATGEYRPGLDAGGGAGNPRLWGFLRSAEGGDFVLDTIMPERYPNASVPRHIHYKVWAPGRPQMDSECFFDADPLLDDATRASAPGNNFPILKLARDADARLTGLLEIRVPKK